MSASDALLILAKLLDDERVKDVLADAIDDSRELAPRVRDDENLPIDRSSVDVVEDIAATVKRLANEQ